MTLKESPLFWPVKLEDKTMRVLDETLLPSKQVYIEVKTVFDAVSVIRDMKTRAFGQFLVVLNTFLMEIRKGPNLSSEKLVKHISKIADELNQSRPTFPFAEVTSIVVGWTQQALAKGEPLQPFLEKNIQGFLFGIRARRLDRVQRIADLIKDGNHILTHCNVSGELAMAGAICQSQGKRIWFFATETRPYFQGARLTCWEMQQMGLNVTLVADNAVGFLMMEKFVDLVIVGSDRSCANGDFANKIGTYQIAVLAKEFGIPFYALTQPSDKVKTGEDIPIEIRDADELLKFNGRQIIPGKVKAFYPGFDVVPHELLTGSISINAQT